MTDLDIAQQRLLNQHVSQQTFTKPEEIVRWMGAIQAQHYAGAKWAIGLRLQNSTDEAVDKAMADGSIIRTHVLRPTWHFVLPADLRWMLELTAPRITAQAAGRYRQLKLDSSIFKKSNDVLAKALEGDRQLSRNEMLEVLDKAGISTNEERFIHLLMQAELDMVICSGARMGKQFSYRLFDERVPQHNKLSYEEAIVELSKRYFLSHSPATLQDFTWWAGLTVTDARAGLEIIKQELSAAKVNGQEYWMPKDLPDAGYKAAIAHLLPAYDEFAVAYKDRTAIINPKYIQQARYVIFDPAIVVNNQVVGTWKQTLKKNKADVLLNPFGILNKTQSKAIELVVKRYGKFMEA